MLRVSSISTPQPQYWRKNPSERLLRAQREALASEMRLKMLDMWKVNIAPLSGAFSIVELYVEFFLNQLDVTRYASHPEERVKIIPKATSALCFYQVLGFAGLIPGALLANPNLENFPPIIHRRVGGEVTTFKLGGNLDQAIGIALAGKLQGYDSPVVAFIGDGELQTGVDHQAKFAAQMQLNNLTLIIDCNQLQSDYYVKQADHTLTQDAHGRLATQSQLWDLYGWQAVDIDGHDFDQIEQAMDCIGCVDKPLVILARTVKGKGISFAEGRLGYNHRMTDAEFQLARREILQTVEIYRRKGYSFSYPYQVTPIQPSRPGQALHLPKLSPPPEQGLEVTMAEWLLQIAALNPGRVFVLNSDNPSPLPIDTPIYTPGKSSFLIFAGSNELFALHLARGMANAGLQPIYVSPATHIMINGEEWKLSAMDDQPLLLVGRTPGSELWRWGQSHLVYEDVERFRTRNATTYQPATNQDLLIVLQHLYSVGMQGPVYFRLPRMPGVNVDHSLYDTPEKKELIVRNGFYVLKSNMISDQESDSFVVFVTSGELVRECLNAAENLERVQIPYKLINVINLSHIAPEKFQETIRGALVIITVIDALPESLAHIVYEVLLPEDRSKVEALGVVESMPVPIPLQEIYKNNHMDCEYLFQFAEAKYRSLISKQGR